MSTYYGPAQLRDFSESLTPGILVSQRIRHSDASNRITGEISVVQAVVESMRPSGHGGLVCTLSDGSSYVRRGSGLMYLCSGHSLGGTGFLHPADQDHHELTRREQLKDALSAAEFRVFDDHVTADQLHALETAASGML